MCPVTDSLDKSCLSVPAMLPWAYRAHVDEFRSEQLNYRIQNMETWMLRLDCAHFSRKEGMSTEAQMAHLVHTCKLFGLFESLHEKKNIPEKCHVENKGY